MTANSASSSLTLWSRLASQWETLFPLQPARLEMAKRWCPPEGAFLDAGCGTGSLVRAMAHADRRAFGFDLDPGFIVQAQRQIATEASLGKVDLGDLRAIDQVFGTTTFDLVVCLGQTLPHLLTDAELTTFLVGAADCLNPGGTLLVQVVDDRDAPAVRDLPVLVGEGLEFRRRRVLVSPQQARFETEIHSDAGVEHMAALHRRLVPEQLADLAIATPLRPVEVWSDESGTPHRKGSPAWILRFVKA